MNLQEEILKIRNEMLDEFDKRVEALKAEEQEFPQNGDKYWFIDDEGSVGSTLYDNHYIDRYHQTIGNFFQTKEEAEFAVEKLKVEAELSKFSRPFKEEEYNYFIQIHPYHNIIVVESDDFYQTQGIIYFESTTIANEAVESVGEERIKKYIFGVED